MRFVTYFCGSMASNQLVYLLFAVLIAGLMWLDLRSLVKFSTETPDNKKALRWTCIWVGTAMLFSLFIYVEQGFEQFAQFQSAYWLEQSLSVDNLFVFLLVFNFFNIAGKAQHKILLWGIFGAMVLRAIFIFSGTWLIHFTYLPPFWKFVNPPHSDSEVGFSQINVLITFFGIILLYGGIKSLLTKEKEEEQDFNESLGARLVRKFFNVTPTEDHEQFWVRTKGKLFFTHLFMVLIIVETTDLLFAIDSIPAIFSIAPDDPFILYSSNIFAILGLRSLFFLLANSLEKFHNLSIGLSVILAFIGFKMVAAPFFDIHNLLSLGIILGILAVAIITSVTGRKTS